MSFLRENWRWSGERRCKQSSYFLGIWRSIPCSPKNKACFLMSTTSPHPEPPANCLIIKDISRKAEEIHSNYTEKKPPCPLFRNMHLIYAKKQTISWKSGDTNRTNVPERHKDELRNRRDNEKKKNFRGVSRRWHLESRRMKSNRNNQ